MHTASMKATVSLSLLIRLLLTGSLGFSLGCVPPKRDRAPSASTRLHRVAVMLALRSDMASSPSLPEPADLMASVDANGERQYVAELLTDISFPDSASPSADFVNAACTIGYFISKDHHLVVFERAAARGKISCIVVDQKGQLIESWTDSSQRLLGYVDNAFQLSPIPRDFLKQIQGASFSISKDEDLQP